MGIKFRVLKFLLFFYLIFTISKTLKTREIKYQ